MYVVHTGLPRRAADPASASAAASASGRVQRPQRRLAMIDDQGVPTYREPEEDLSYLQSLNDDTAGPDPAGDAQVACA
jgi:hypothetical protein